MPLEHVKELGAEVVEEGFHSSYYGSQEQIRKILINSMYGVLGNKFFSFYNVKNAMAITIGARDMITYVSSNVNKYFKQYYHKIAHKHFPELKGKEIKPLKNDLVVLIDTDSSYLCLDEIIKNSGFKFANDDEYRDWANKIDKEIFTPFFNKILDMRAKKYNTKNQMNFKREKIITKMIVLAKKKYSVLCIDKEGKRYKEPDIQTTGIEIVRTSTPAFCRTRIEDVMKFIFEHKDKERTLDLLREIYTDFKEAPIDDISFPRGVSDYDKYSKPLKWYRENGLVYQKSTPIHVRAAICYNHAIDKHNLKLQHISNGTKCKFLMVDENNDMHTNAIAYIGKWPKEYNDLFKVDYEEQWEKSFQNVIQRFFDVLDWGDINLEKNETESFIQF